MAGNDILFEYLDGHLIPVPARGYDGSFVTADKRTIFTLKQAVAKFGMAEDELRALYSNTFKRLVPPELLPSLSRRSASATDVLRMSEEEQLLRRRRYGHLSDEDFCVMVAECRRRGLDPWLGHVIAEMRHNETTRLPEMTIYTTLAGMRTHARNSGRYVGRDGPFWCSRDGAWRDVWLADDPPYAAKVGVRLHRPDALVWGVSRWDEIAPFKMGDGGEVVYPQMWARMPARMLAKTAEVDGLRAAFPEFGSLYIREEMEQRDNPPRRLKPPAPAPRVDDLLTGSPMMFAIELSAYGFRTDEQRAKLVEQFRTHHAALYEQNEAAFRATVLRAVYANPEAYGGVRPPSM